MGKHRKRRRSKPRRKKRRANPTQDERSSPRAVVLGPKHLAALAIATVMGTGLFLWLHWRKLQRRQEHRHKHQHDHTEPGGRRNGHGGK